MPDSHDRSEKSDNTNAQEKMRVALERSVAEIKTPAQARHTLDSLEKSAGDLREDDVAGARERGRGDPGGQGDRIRSCPLRRLVGEQNPTGLPRTPGGDAATCATNYLSGSVRCR